jgi:3-methyl-2-oxobutanoate hydroxymethyltransferase
VHAILDAEIPVMGHIGLTPQSIHALGGFKVQGKELDTAKRLADDACALADAGCFAIVLECVPDGVARVITDAVPVPTIGIGAGRHCDGQVLVWHDMLGLTAGHVPKFVKQYADLGRETMKALEAYVTDVRAGRFPEAQHTYSMPDDQRELFEADLATFLHEKG